MKSLENTRDRQCNKGFTLVEILVATFIFGLVITIAIGVFSQSSNVQIVTGIARTAVQDERFSLEDMSRDIRLSEGGFEFGSSGNSLILYKLNDAKARISYKTYSYDSTSKKLTVDGQSLFSDEFSINKDGINPIFSGYFPSVDSKEQPYVTIDFKIDNSATGSGKAKKKSEEIIQTLRTTVTSRAYNQVGPWMQ